MQIILKKNVDNVGSLGDVVKVKDGYARNYLIPRGYAARATEGQIKAIELEKKQREHKIELERKQARDLSDTLESLTLRISVKAGDEGRLFGSVTTSHIAEALKGAGHTIDKRHIVIPNMIKEVGKHKVTVKVYEGVLANVSVLVEAS